MSKGNIKGKAEQFADRAKNSIDVNAIKKGAQEAKVT
ncbi:hypothetical protein VHP8226_01695 [Vibrio hippocampi]|uniref:CsbD family protein n=1 Tax=Vibrio hippocampi TaxID=654686 RepID=A0ABN8DG05_9VIBR|nr:hypothetical protein VHP8226_01695 [Vibrio hippocampi]